MSEILKKIKQDLSEAMKKEIKSRKQGWDIDSNSFIINQKEVSRFIISMIPQLGIKLDKVSDEDIIKLLKIYIKNEKMKFLYQNKHINSTHIKGLNQKEISKLEKLKLYELGDTLTSQTIKIAEQYLPSKATNGEIIKWINSNIDFSTFKNKMQAMKPIISYFGSRVEGNKVKKIIIENY